MKEIYSPKPNPSALPWVGSLLMTKNGTHDLSTWNVVSDIMKIIESDVFKEYPNIQVMKNTS